MAVVDTDIVVYGSANMQETDSGTQGGARSTTTLIVFTDLAANDTIDAVSSSASDTTQTVTVYGRLPTGELTSENLGTLTGTTPITGSTTFERIMKVVISATTVGNITISENSGGTPIKVMPAGITEVRRPFYDVSAEASGGSPVVVYEKIFFENENTTSALLNATIEEITDVSGGASIDFDLESSLDGTDTSTNRITAPGGYTFNSTTKNVSNSGTHSPETAQGVWLRLTLPAGEAAANSSYTMRESGQTA